MKKMYRKTAACMWLSAVLAVAACCGGCGAKYEPISLDETTGAAGRSNSLPSQPEQEKETAARMEGTGEENHGTQADDFKETSEGLGDGETTGVGGLDESETGLQDELPGSETEESISADDMFYQQCGMSREEAEHGRISFIEDVMNDSREAIASRIAYPRTVTVSSGSYEVQDAVGFLAYYDEIFSEAFKAELDAQAEQELFCQDGMISFGEGLIWFYPSDSGSNMSVSSINNKNGCSVSYGGEQGVTAGP